MTTTASTVLSPPDQLMQDILYRVRQVNRMPPDICTSLLSFTVNGLKLGVVRPAIANLLCSVDSSVFCLQQQQQEPLDRDGSNEKTVLTLHPRLLTTHGCIDDDGGVDACTKAVAGVMNQLRQEGVIKGWRDELYPVSDAFYNNPVFLVERAAVPLLGALEYGVHINGLVRRRRATEKSSSSSSNDGGDDDVSSSVHMWMARRSATKSKYPNMMDHIAAGGQPAGLSLMDNVVKECMEEAGIPEHLCRAGIRPAGALSYETYSSRSDTVTRAVLFNYDLWLPPDFVPTPVDGEVQEFVLWSLEDVWASMARDCPDPIKPNCYSVIIDFLVREGYVSPEVPGYLDVVRELRSGDCQ
jgi:hypothetical protein